MKKLGNNDPVVITQGNVILQPEYDKLSKMEKLLAKVETDLGKRLKDIEQGAVVDVLQKTHQLYQLILAEVHYQLGQLCLDKFTSIVEKIFSGQNTLLEILLKLRVDSELDPDQFMENLQNLKRNKKPKRSQSLNRQESELQSPVLKKSEFSAPSQLKRQLMGSMNGFEKKYAEVGTDTDVDREQAKDVNQIMMKQKELEEISKDLESANDDVSEFLKNKRNFDQSDASNAERSLKTVLKDLSLKKKRAELIEEEGQALLSREENLRSGYQTMEADLRNGLQDVAYKAKAAQEFQLRQNFKINKVQVDVSEQSTNTEKDVLREKFEKLAIEVKGKEKTQVDIEKKCKESKRDVEVLEAKVKQLNAKIDEYVFLERKREDESKRCKNDMSLSQQEKQKIKKYIEDNIKLKLKMKDLIDEIKKIEEENKQNMDKFRRFILSSNLTDEQKKQLLGKSEELFRSDITKRLKMKEMEQMAKIDQNMLSDGLVKDIVGADAGSLVRQIKADAKAKAVERTDPAYDEEFDSEYLEKGQKIVVRTVKKRVKRLNSKGQLVEDEVEVEEEVVVDQNGKEIRKRDKPKVKGVVTDPAIVDFINKHGGLAVGGSKFVLPKKPGRPVAKDGKPAVEGEWFTDSLGNKVKLVKGQNGEEEYEIEEKYINEKGVEKTRVKKMKLKKDANGEEYTEEIYTDPATGKKLQVVKKVIKDNDGAEVVEEVITDETGKKVTKRTKVKKDNEGNDVVEEEVIDAQGNKQIIRTKKIKDAQGNSVIVKEIINADGSKVVQTEKIDKAGNRTVVEEKTNAFGQKTKVEKKVVVGADGKPQIEETILDEKGNKLTKKTKILVDEKGNAYTQEEVIDSQGNKVVKNIRQKIDKNGNQYIEEETVDAKGNKLVKVIRKQVDKDGNEQVEEEITDALGNKAIKITKKKIDKDGREYIEEETIDSNGNKVVKKIKKQVDSDGLGAVEEEEIQNADGTKKIIRKKIDKEGNLVEEEEFVDEKGDKIIIKKIRNKDGKVTEERINETTGEKVIVKKTKDSNGNEIVEQIKIDSSGKATTTKQVIGKDLQGNTVIEETYVDPTSGETLTKKKIITKSKDGKEHVEEVVVDSKGNVKTAVKTKVYQDKDGKKVIEEEVTGQDGKKYTVKKKVFEDAEGNKIEEVETVDAQGNKVITTKRQGADGKYIVEETKIDKDGKKTVTQKVVHKNGVIEETTIDSSGKVTIKKVKQGTEDKSIQVDQQSTPYGLKNALLLFGCPTEKVDELVEAIMKYIQKGEAIVIGDSQSISKKILEKGISLAGMEIVQRKKYDKKGKKIEEEEEERLETLDGLSEDQQMEALFKKMNAKKNEFGEVFRSVRNHLGKQGDEEVGIEDFKKYLKKFTEVHLKCGENCPHLRRFYERLGFTWLKYKRRYLKLKDTRIQAFNAPKVTDQSTLPVAKDSTQNPSPERGTAQVLRKSFMVQKKQTADQDGKKQFWNQEVANSKQDLNVSDDLLQDLNNLKQV